MLPAVCIKVLQLNVTLAPWMVSRRPGSAMRQPAYALVCRQDTRASAAASAAYPRDVPIAWPLSFSTAPTF